MSSSPPTDARRFRRLLAGWSLRARLLAAIVGLLAVVCVTIGAATTFAVYQVQLGQLDRQLMSASIRDNDALTPLPDAGQHPTGRPPTAGLAQPPGTISVHYLSLSGEYDVKQLVGSDGRPIALTDAQLATVTSVAPDHRPHALAVPGLGDYHVLAFQAPDHDLVVTGLPLRDVEATRNWLVLLELGIGLAAIVLAAALGTVIIRTTLRPLQRVVATARRVAELPLDRGEVALSVRVPEVDTDPRTEVGQVGAALNRMLGHVADALSARQASEMRVRHFVADASHELRTPLAAIRGYAELSRRVHEGVPDAVAYAMRRVESETNRMTSLV